MAKCPSCAENVPDLYPVDATLRQRMQKIDPGYPVSSGLCKTCLIDLRKRAFGSAGIVMASERDVEGRKKMLWMSRVPLIKKGQAYMANRQFGEAAVSYEKYLRVLEKSFECEPGTLMPESLKEAAKTAELTIIATAYWDLLRIYDANDKYLDQQRHAANQLAKFINYTPIYPDIMRKAEVFARTAKHPDIVKLFITNSKKKRTRCFIATSAFEVPISFEVQFLRIYRDQVLKKNYFGRKFVLFYYKVSPFIARFLDSQTWLKPAVRAILRFVIKCVS